METSALTNEVRLTIKKNILDMSTFSSGNLLHDECGCYSSLYFQGLKDMFEEACRLVLHPDEPQNHEQCCSCSIS